MSVPLGYAPEWTEEERERHKQALRDNQPHLQAHAEHADGECEHCDLLRQLQAEVVDEP